MIYVVSYVYMYNQMHVQYVFTCVHDIDTSFFYRCDVIYMCNTFVYIYIYTIYIYVYVDICIYILYICI